MAAVSSSQSRKTAVYLDSSERFQLWENSSNSSKTSKGRNFERQYAQFYAVRLMHLKKRVIESARISWGTSLPIRRVCELLPGEECLMAGTLIKQLKLRPSVIKEVSNELGINLGPIGHRIAEASDTVWLEDEVQRVQLAPADQPQLPGLAFDPQLLVNGLVVIVRGLVPLDRPSIFLVHRFLFPQLPPQEPLPSADEDKYVMLLSGLDLFSTDLSASPSCVAPVASASASAAAGESRRTLTPCRHLVNLQLFVDTLCGAGSAAQDPLVETMRSVVRLVLAGNCLSAELHAAEREQLSRARYLMRKHSLQASVDGLRLLDRFLAMLASSIEVDVMPGEQDACTCLLPQQPMHHALLPEAFQYSGIRTVCNPYEFCVDGVRFLGTSGQNVEDVVRTCAGFGETPEEHLRVAELTLKCAHLAPTAPDTLPAYPFVDEDPFVLERHCPHVYFVGNQERFAFSRIEGADGQHVLCVLVPRFSVTKSAVLVNLRTLEPKLIDFAF